MEAAPSTLGRFIRRNFLHRLVGAARRSSIPNFKGLSRFLVIGERKIFGEIRAIVRIADDANQIMMRMLKEFSLETLTVENHNMSVLERQADEAAFRVRRHITDGEIRRVGRDLFSLQYPNALAALLVSTILVEFSTLLAVPLSSTQTLSAGVLGAGAAYRHRLFSLRPFLLVAVAWVIVPTISFTVGYFL